MGGTFMGDSQCIASPSTGANCGPTGGSSSSGGDPSSQESSAATPCGNGLPDEGEQCDLGIYNSNTPNALCRTDCTSARCGDGIVDTNPSGRPKERCDDDGRNSDTEPGACKTNCKYRNTYFTLGQWLQNLQLYAIDGVPVPDAPETNENTQFLVIGALTFILM